MVRPELALAILAASAACVSGEVTRCADGSACPASQRCARFNDRTFCVDPDRLPPCDGRRDGEICQTTSYEGTCADGACLPIGCGNGFVDDPVYGTDEQCDDGDRIGHDGCSSDRCQVERPSWQPIVTNVDAPERDFVLVHDASRRSGLVFGGASYGGPSSGTFELRGDALVTAAQISVVPARIDHAMAFDGARSRVVLFGGIAAGGFADTWEWDGEQWSAAAPETAPSIRAEQAIAYDAIRRVTVMIGNAKGDPATTVETWEWDGTVWAERQLAVAPPQTQARLATFDPARGVIVLFAGEAGRTSVWEYDGAWRAVPGDAPIDLVEARLAYDGAARRVVIVTAAFDTWIWDGGGWTQGPSLVGLGSDGFALTSDAVTGRATMLVGTTAGFEARTFDGATWEPPTVIRLGDRVVVGSNYAAAYDPIERRVLGFGLRIRSTASPVTLSRTDAGWTSSVTGQPPPRTLHAITFDSARREFVMFGGIPVPSTGVADGTTWVWRDDAWTARVVTGPPTRGRHAMAFSVADGKVVLFGGIGGGVAFDDTWTWDGTAWQQIAGGPAARFGHAMAYDPVRDEIVLFGGHTSSAFLADTWVWRQGTWIQRTPATTPPSRFDHALVWDAARRRLVLVGGTGTENGSIQIARLDMWEWDGTNWAPLPISAGPIAPPPVIEPPVIAAVTEPTGGVLVLNAGGIDLSPMRLRWDADVSYEACASVDRDRDGLVGCADPDCWWTCAPLCPAQTSCAVGPSCGDGTCDANETCAACPADCGACATWCGDFVCASGEDCPGDCAR